MNDYKGMRIWQFTVLLLVVCNVALIATIWLKPALDRPARPGGPRDFVVQQLKFSDEQTKKYDALIQAHQQAMGKLRHEAMDLRRELFRNLENEGQNSALTDSIAGLIGHNQEAIELVTYRHFAEVRALCNDEQKKEFDNIIGDVIKKMNGGPGGQHPPQHEGQPPPPPEDGGGPPPGKPGQPQGEGQNPPPPPEGGGPPPGGHQPLQGDR